MLLTDPEFGVSAQTVESAEPGSVGPAVGAPGDLRFELVPNAKEVRKGDRIITAGTSTSSRVERPAVAVPARHHHRHGQAVSRPARASSTA